MSWKQNYARAMAVAVGLAYVASGLALLLAQDWFFNNIGNYPPYNRHYMGDAGSFTLGLGLILLWAARDTARYRVMIALVGVSSLVHAINHVIEDFMTNPSPVSMANNVLLFVLALALFLAAWWGNARQETKAASRAAQPT